MTTIQLALLICDKAVQGDYGQIFEQLLSDALARISDDIAFTLDTFDVVKGIYPTDDIHYDGLLISGSRASAYEDVEWINTLVAYTKRVVTEKPSLKVFGICFGHQIIARALGGSCVQNNGLWEVAVTTIQLTTLGKAIFGSDQLDLQQMHRDHVPISPPDAHFLGSTGVTPNQGMVIFDPETAPSLDSDPLQVDLTSIHVLTVQGHPEFTESIMSRLLDTRVALLGQEIVDEARLRAGGIPGKYHPDGLACDGVGKVGKVIWGVLGVAPQP